jgi:protein TonB
MAVLIMAPELQLPWESSGPEDKRFYRMLRNWLLGLVALAVLVPILPVAERIRDQSEQLPPQLARVILEKQALPEPVPVQPKPTPQPRPVEPAAVKPKPAEQKPVDKPKPVQQTRANATDTMEQARDAAAVAGVLAFQDDLSEMRDALDVEAMPQTVTSRGEARAAKVERSLITSANTVSSGGINTAALSRDTGGPALSGRESTRVESTIAGTAQKAAPGRSEQLGGRSDESIRQIMDRNKGAIFAIYNRALRKDPLLEGKLVFEMVIAASGEVAELKLLSSELVDAELTRKILSRIRLIQFDPQDVVATRVNYSFDFLPYS